MSLDDADLFRLAHLNFAAFGRESTRWSRAGRLLETEGVMLAASGSDFPVLCNAAARTDDRVKAAEVLDRADAWFGELGRGYTVMTRDLPVDADLAQEAEARGLLAVVTPPEMVCRQRLPERDLPAGVELRWVHDDAGIADFITVTATAYGSLGMPPEVVPAMIEPGPLMVEPHVHTVLAYLDGEPVAAAQTLLSHGIAGVYWVGTLEAARGKGLGEAVTRAVTNRAFDRGALANSLQASPMGEPLYPRMGYETIYRYTGYTRFEPA
jgi:GNAT superfamily N-acetyltransferase